MRLTWTPLPSGSDPGLAAGSHDFQLRTVTPPHAFNANRIESLPTPVARD